MMRLSGLLKQHSESDENVSVTFLGFLYDPLSARQDQKNIIYMNIMIK